MPKQSFFVLSILQPAFLCTRVWYKRLGAILAVGMNSGMYTIALENGFSYSVPVFWNRDGSLVNKSKMGTLAFDTLDNSVEKDRVVLP
jgi:hypothetical protein